MRKKNQYFLHAMLHKENNEEIRATTGRRDTLLKLPFDKTIFIKFSIILNDTSISKLRAFAFYSDFDEAFDARMIIAYMHCRS
jgi:hypothetical protein